MSQVMPATFQAPNAPATSDDLDLNIQFGGSTFISLSRATATASTPSAFAVLGGPQESSEQPGTPRNASGAVELIPHLLSLSTITKEIEVTIPPLFDGTTCGSAARRWFNRVELHFFVNQHSFVAKDILRKIGLTLGWIRGPGVDHWVDKKVDWIMDQAQGRTVVADPWTEFRQDFIQSFSNVMEARRASADLKKLEMKDGDIDEYIRTFENLADLAQPYLYLDSTTTLDTFMKGLPTLLAKKCLLNAKELPKTFTEWCTLARRYQEIDERVKSLDADWKVANMDNNDDKTTWRRKGNTQQVSLAESGPRGCVADVDINRRAVTEDDKAKYRAEGRCFKCGGQGHRSRDCLL